MKIYFQYCTLSSDYPAPLFVFYMSSVPFCDSPYSSPITSLSPNWYYQRHPMVSVLESLILSKLKLEKYWCPTWLYSSHLSRPNRNLSDTTPFYFKAARFDQYRLSSGFLYKSSNQSKCHYLWDISNIIECIYLHFRTLYITYIL
jgi:hypothetical protein